MDSLKYTRRDFIRSGAIASLGLGIIPLSYAKEAKPKELRIGIIGLDTSHSVAFTKILNASPSLPGFEGVKVTVACSAAGSDIETNVVRMPGFIEEMKNLGVHLVNTIAEVLQASDVILLESNDGRMRYEQVKEILKSRKLIFMDKPVASSLQDVIRIYKAAEASNISVYSSSLLRYVSNISEIEKGGDIQGASTYSPAMTEKTHPDLFWYGIHGVEMLYRIMGTGCKTVSRISTEDTDVVTGVWQDGRIGTFRGLRKGKSGFGGTVFTEKEIINIVPPKDYVPLVVDIVKFFKTGVVPVQPIETIEIYAFMEAADESLRQHGKAISVIDFLTEASNY